MNRPQVKERPEFRIIFLDTREDGVTEEYLKHTGFYSEWEAREHMKGIAPTRKPQLVRVIGGWTPDTKLPITEDGCCSECGADVEHGICPDCKPCRYCGAPSVYGVCDSCELEHADDR